MSLGIDYAWQHPDPSAIKAAGYDFVLRYLSSDPTKNITVTEASALHAVGLGVGLIWENQAQAALNGAPQGASDAVAANSQADALGAPDIPIFYAVDFDAQPSQMPAIVAYFQAAVAHSSRPVGGYGSAALVQAIQNVCPYYMQAEAWSGDTVQPFANLYQRVTPTLPTIAGAQGIYDEDEMRLNVPLWMPASATPVAGPSAPCVGYARSSSGNGYWQTDANGVVKAFGDATHLGDMSGQTLNKPVVGMASTKTGNGYWLVASDGGIFSFGDAPFDGSAGAITLNKPIVGMASDPVAPGYYLVASDGGIFTYGAATFFGSTGGMTLNKPIVGMAEVPDGSGYWLVASDGGVFTFGAVKFYGSTGNMVLNKPVVGMASTPSGNGYWLVASDGGVFTFGDAVYHGSTGSISLSQPVIGLLPTASGNGYWLMAADGGVFTFGDAVFYGSGA